MAFTTNINNVPNILENGIIPRASLENGEFCFNDEARIDGVLSANCLSISFPNYKMLNTLRHKKDMKVFCLLVIDPNIICDKEAYFFKTNASNHEFSDKIQQDLSCFQGVDAFNELFYDDVLRSELRLPDKYTTDPQAEVMVKGIIEPRYIKKIIFINKVDMESIGITIPSTITIEYHYKLLGGRCDWNHWVKE